MIRSRARRYVAAGLGFGLIVGAGAGRAAAQGPVPPLPPLAPAGGLPPAGSKWSLDAFPQGPPSGQIPGAVAPLPADTGAPAGALPPAPPTLGGGLGTAPGATPALDAVAAGAAPAFAAPAPATGAGAAPYSGLGGVLGAGEAGLVTMLGDSGPIPRLALIPAQRPNVPPPVWPPIPGEPNQQYQAAALVPSLRSFKISENQSPKPQDRIYFSFNFYDDVNQSINSRIGSPIFGMQVYRYLLGVEKTVLDGRGSIGLRLPINNLVANSFDRRLGGSSTSAGDLSVILKYAPWWNRDTGSLVSGGLMITAPTGPNQFAGYPNIYSPHSTALTPWMGWIYNMDRLYFHGFNSLDIPLANDDVLVFYNDTGLGYFLYRATEPGRLLTAVVPTFETHVNIPLNHSGNFDIADPLWTPSVVNLTAGCHFGIGRRGWLTVGYVTPVTGPNPFQNEWIGQFNLQF
jgi:hypothetical protein